MVVDEIVTERAAQMVLQNLGKQRQVTVSHSTGDGVVIEYTSKRPIPGTKSPAIT